MRIDLRVLYTGYYILLDSPHIVSAYTYHCFRDSYLIHKSTQKETAITLTAAAATNAQAERSEQNAGARPKQKRLRQSWAGDNLSTPIQCCLLAALEMLLLLLKQALRALYAMLHRVCLGEALHAVCICGCGGGTHVCVRVQIVHFSGWSKSRAQVRIYTVIHTYLRTQLHTLPHMQNT